VRKPCRPQQLVKDAVEFSLRGSSTKPVFEVANSLWSVKVDVGQVTQALSNVVLNAREAMDGDGTLKVYANNVRVADGDPIALQPGPYVEIAIRDSGRGMTAETLEHIFDPYFTTKDHGTGLGLAVAYSVLQRHGGLLRAESQLGAGSSFFIYLPAEETGPQVESEPTVPRKVRAATGRVLVMDDEPRLRDLLADCLVALGCRVETAADGAEAIAAYRQAMQKGQPFDVVILDLTVRGGMGGVETVTHLRELNPEVQAIASSGYADDPVMSNFGRYGFVAALNKPFRFAMLARTVRNIVGAESTNERAVATLEASGADSH
jgi:CheY-like chemotaxis protein